MLLLYIVFVIVWIIYKRGKALRLGIGWTIAALLWLFGALFLLAFGVDAWKTSFVVALLTSSRLDLLAFALSLIAFLSYANPSAMHSDRSDMRRAWFVAAAAAVHFTLLVAPSIIPVLVIIPPLRTLAFRLLPLSVVLQAFADAASYGMPGQHRFWLQWFDFALFRGALAYLIVNQDKEDDDASRRKLPVRDQFASHANFGSRQG